MEQPVCVCGKRHPALTTKIEIGRGILGRAGQIFAQSDIQGPYLMVCDQNTYRAAGQELESGLDKAGAVCRHDFDVLDAATMEDAQEIAQAAQRSRVRTIVAVGTGTLCDLCRYAAHLQGLPFVAVATAPSMDGFCSGVAPLIENGFKRTYAAVTPVLVIGDTGVMDQCPRELIGAGIGDLLGKYTALCDWRIAHVLTGEDYCRKISGMVGQSVQRALQAVDGVLSGVQGSTGPVLEALCLSGQAMALCGNSRPASGAEHHIAHFLEMRFLQLGRKQIYHGVKVGVATIQLSQIYQKLAEIEDIGPYLRPRPALTAQRLNPIYGRLTQDVLKDNTPDPLESISAVQLAAHWQDVRRQLQMVSSGEEIARILKKLCAPVTPEEIGVDSKMMRDAIEFGRYVRSRLTMLRLCDLLDVDILSCNRS